MFDNPAGYAVLSSKSCLPDPEEQLANIRKRREVRTRAESLLLELAGLPIHFEIREAEHAIATMLGELHIQTHQLKQQEAHLLDEINEEAAK